MKMTFLGAAREVGRSGVLLEDEHNRVLLDYGIKVSSDDPYPLPIKGYVDGAVLSHAHLDHSGFLPALYNRSEMHTFMTPPTMPIIEILLKDTIKIADEEDSKLPYGEQELKRLLRNIIQVRYDKKKQVTQDVSFKFQDAGHIAGASIVDMDFHGTNVVYTGDFNMHRTRLHEPAYDDFKDVDVLVIEGTYGDRDHPDRNKEEERFAEECKAVIEDDGTVLVPAFALGRSQEVITILKERKVHAPIYMDGMAKSISEIMLDFPEYVANYESMHRALMDVTWVNSTMIRKQATEKGGIIVTPAGMMQGGHVINYFLKLLKNNPRMAVLLTGYQPENSPGHGLLEEKRFRLGDLDINCSGLNVQKFDFSAHADRTDLHAFIKKISPRLVVVNHGDEGPARQLAQWTNDELGIQALVPSFGQSLDISQYL